ncbi:phage tail protein [Flavobacterium cucumis]|uniref:Microcystin-dependent protein n=1 Tax=Flavobacterium cucumis TaxID=416016 RepID=A0A1M7ZYX5_9FLAO|nr:tail fiber protein [Flavobacterium cucumis]SHO74010.1 Microcystin-dependent protein [Flavobacterium cucumis]
MSTEPFIGEIKIFGFNFAPQSYQLCSGQIMSIAQNTALFSLLGTTYGGNGQTTFALPDLRGRMPIGQGQGPGLPNYSMGQLSGTTSVTILTSNLPAHTHAAQGITVNMPVSNAGGDTDSPQGAYLANNGSEVFSSEPTPGANYAPLSASGQTSIVGSNIPISILNPYLTINYSIAIYGIFPSRN